MTDATDLDEAAMRARVEAATEGPWRWDSWRDDLHHLIGRGGSPETYEYDVEVIEPEHSGECGCRSACYLSNSVSEADREFIAHARTDLPAALDANTRLRAALDEAHAEVERWQGDAVKFCDDYHAELERRLAAESTLAAVRADLKTLAFDMHRGWKHVASGADAAVLIDKLLDSHTAALATPTTSDEGDDDE